MRRWSPAIALFVVALGIAPVPAHATTASCGGLAPLDVRCETTLTPTTNEVAVTLTTAPTFVGMVEITFERGETSIGFPCVQVSLATECTGSITGMFPPGSPVAMRAEILTVNKVVGPLPVEDVTPSIGTWTVTATG
jgi:hypothetical protein